MNTENTLSILTGDPRKIAKRMTGYAQQPAAYDTDDLCLALANALNRIKALENQVHILQDTTGENQASGFA